MSRIKQIKINIYKIGLLLTGLMLLGWPLCSTAAEPAKAAAASLGPGFMLRIATQPLLLLVGVEPLQLRFAGKGARLRDALGVYRPVRADSVPRALQGLKGGRVSLYAPSGRACTGVIREYVFVNRGEEGEPEPGDDDAAPASDELSPGSGGPASPSASQPPPKSARGERPIPAERWRLGPREAWSAESGERALAVRVEPDPGCATDGLRWGRLASLPAAEIYPATAPDPALQKAVLKASLRLFSANPLEASRCADCDEAAPFKHWPDYVRKNLNIHVFHNPHSGRRMISASAGFRDDGACSQSGNFALFEQARPGAPLRRIRATETGPSFVEAAADLDGDGWPELVVWAGDIASYVDGTTLLFSDGGRYRRSQNLHVAWSCSE